MIDSTLYIIMKCDWYTENVSCENNNETTSQSQTNKEDD